jgi:DNA-directed RNA polymerase specialized sigma24 family protein
MDDESTLSNEVFKNAIADVEHFARRVIFFRNPAEKGGLEDIKQDSLLALTKALRGNPALAKKMRNDALRRAYVIKCLRSAAWAWARKRHKTPATWESTAEAAADPRPLNPESSLENAEFSQWLMGLYRSLPTDSDARFAIDKILYGATYSGRAESLGISTRTARRRFMRGVNELRRAIKESQIA